MQSVLMDKPGKPEYHEKGTIWLLAKSCLSIKKVRITSHQAAVDIAGDNHLIAVSIDLLYVQALISEYMYV